MINFPEGIRLANSVDLADLPGFLELLNQVSMAKIEQGYVVSSIENNLDQKYVEINIDSQRTWSLFCSLCEKLLPIKTEPMIGDIDEETFFIGKYSNTMETIKLFKEFEFYLANDCHLQVGFRDESCAVIITTTKYLKVWTNRNDVLKDTMKKYGLLQIDDLQFIDEFPRTIINLDYKDVFYGYEELIKKLIEIVS
jgi:hypothetical protein